MNVVFKIPTTVKKYNYCNDVCRTVTDIVYRIHLFTYSKHVKLNNFTLYGIYKRVSVHLYIYVSIILCIALKNTLKYYYYYT